MNKLKIFLISLFSLIGYSNLIAQTYDQDASEVDFYVPGILANDAMQQVNFPQLLEAEKSAGPVEHIQFHYKLSQMPLS